MRGVRVTSWLSPIVVLGVVLVAGAPAQAGIKVTGGGIKQFGEPAYWYIFKVYLDPDTTMGGDDSFTLGDHSKGSDLVDVKSGLSATIEPNGPPDDPSGPWTPKFFSEGTGPLPGYPRTNYPLADVKFTNAGSSITNDSSNEFYLGTFQILSASSGLPQLPLSYTLTIDWTAILDNGTQPDSGSVTLGVITAVPEPATFLLLAAGLGLPVVWHLHQRRKSA